MATPVLIYGTVLSNIIDANSDVAATVLDKIAQAIRNLDNLRLFPVNRAEETIVTVEDTRKLDDLPSDWNGVRKNPWYIDGTGAATPMRWISEDSSEVEKIFSEDPLDKGAPAEVMVTGDDELWIYPLPDGLAATGTVYSDGDYRVHIPYWKKLPALAPTGSNFFTTDDSLTLQYIEEWVTAECLTFNRDHEDAAVWTVKAADTLKKIKYKAKSDLLPRHINLAPRRSVKASRRQGRYF
jgi:hypothetical protein